MKLNRFLAVLAAVLLIGIPAFAQTTANLTGTVTLGGNPLPGATVTISSPNLLGTRTIATLGYESDPDRNTFIAGFDTPRLIANRVGVGASYSQRSADRSYRLER